MIVDLLLHTEPRTMQCPRSRWREMVGDIPLLRRYFCLLSILPAQGPCGGCLDVTQYPSLKTLAAAQASRIWLPRTAAGQSRVKLPVESLHAQAHLPYLHLRSSATSATSTCKLGPEELA